MAARFSRNFVGPGRYEIVDVPGGVAFRSVFDGVRCKGFLRLFPTRVALSLHARAERGARPFPFPKKTGFVNLGAPRSSQ